MTWHWRKGLTEKAGEGGGKKSPWGYRKEGIKVFQAENCTCESTWPRDTTGVFWNYLPFKLEE